MASPVSAESAASFSVWCRKQLMVLSGSKSLVSTYSIGDRRVRRLFPTEEAAQTFVGWRDMNFESGIISVRAGHSRTKRRRTVPMADNPRA